MKFRTAARTASDQSERDAILNAIRTGVYGIDDEGRCTFINKAALHMLGYALDEVLGRNMHALIHHTLPDGSPYPPSACPVVQTLRTGHSVELDSETLWRKDGSFFMAEYSSFPVLDEGVVTGSVITFQDTSQRGQAQKRLAVQITVSRILAGSAEVHQALHQVVAAIGSGLGFEVGVFWTVGRNDQLISSTAVWASPEIDAASFIAVTDSRSLARGEGLPGQVWETLELEQLEDLASAPPSERRKAALEAGLRTGFAFPVRVGKTILGVMEFYGRNRARLDEDFLESIATLGQQIGQYLRRKMAEEGLRESEARALAAERRLKLALESGRIGAWSWDSTTDLVDADGRVREIFGLDRIGPVPATELFSRIHPEDIQRATAVVERARQTSGEYDLEFRIVLPSKEVRWVVARGLVASGSGAESGLTMIGTTWDVTEQKVAEAALRHSEERFRSLIDATAAVVWTTQASGEFGEDQPSWRSFTGQSAGEMKGWGWLKAVHPDDRKATAAAWREAVETQTIYKAEHRLRRRDGEYRYMLVRAVPILRKNGAVREWVGVHTDITTRKRAEEELAAAKEAAEEANRAKSQFIANMSHELRTPLSAVIGYAEMLEEEVEDLGEGGMLEDLRKIESNARHLLTLINDVLDLSKIEAGKMEVHPEDFDAGTLVREVADTVEGLVAKKENELVVRCGPDLGTVHSDPVKVRQCLFNLLSNAAKFTEKGRITLSADRVAVDGRDELVFQVADTGIGMSAEEMQKLFKRFSQADTSTTRRFGGTGLGLSITKAFCTMLGGDIAVESEPEKGATFTIRVPADLRRVRAEAPESNAAEAPAGEDASNLVLVIDDDPSTRELLSRFLKREGFSVRTAGDGAAGLRYARELAPCAILLDVMMPRMDGWAVLSALKADPDLAEIPVIMITMVQEKGLGFALGAADYLTKPVQWPRLKKVLDRHRCEITPRRALLIEADPPLRGELRGLLEQEGWAVTEADSVEGAIKRIEEAPPELILVDLQTSDSSGFGFIQRLRRHPQWRAIPVIAVTDEQLTPAERERLEGQVRQVVQAGDQSTEELVAELRRIAAARARNTASPAQRETHHA